MALTNFVPKYWSTNILWNLRKNLVFAGLTNRDYKGEIANAGDTVHIQTPNAITVQPYTGAVTYEMPTSTTQALLIDKTAYWAFEDPDVLELQSNVNLMRTYLREATYAMSDNMDKDIASLYADAGITVALSVAADSTGVRKALVEANEKLSVNNVPMAGRWLVVSPKVDAAIRLATDFVPATGLGDGILVNGYVGRLEGFAIYLSNNVAIATQHKCMFGTNASITMAIQQEPKVEAMRLEAKFSDGVRALMVWGRKVVRPTALGVLNTTVA